MVKHFENEGGCRALTFSCYQHRKLLVRDDWCELLSRSIDHACAGHRYLLGAFVFMPNHVHLLVWPEIGASTIDRFLFAIKRPFSYRIKQLLIGSSDPLRTELTVRQRPGKETFRFWQEGPGHDRNLVEPTWAEGSVEYIHRNPVRAGLCNRTTEWTWSSARWHEDPTTPQDPRLPRLTAFPSEFLDSRQ